MFLRFSLHFQTFINTFDVCMGMHYIQKSLFSKLKKEIEAMDKLHDDSQAYMRSCLLLSKKSISASHKEDLKEAHKILDQLKKKVVGYKKTSRDKFVYNMIWQEYVEAAIYLCFVENKPVPTPEELGISADSFFLGLCDASGEIVRYALHHALKQNLPKVNESQIFLDELYNGTQQIVLRQGDMRKKADKVRWDLDRVSTILFDMKRKNG